MLVVNWLKSPAICDLERPCIWREVTAQCRAIEEGSRRSRAQIRHELRDKLATEAKRQ